MNHFDEQMRQLEQEYPEGKPVCFNYSTARNLIFRLMKENHELHHSLMQASSILQ